MNAYVEKLLARKSGRPLPSQAKPPVPVLLAAAPVSLSARLAEYPHHMTLNDVAQYLAISVDQVSKLRDGGELEFLDISSPGAARPAWRIARASVAALEASRQTTPRK